MNENRYYLTYARPTGGKAGKGFNKTSTIRVCDMEESRIIKQFRYIVNDYESKKNAIEKGKEFIRQLKELNK